MSQRTSKGIISTSMFSPDPARVMDPSCFLRSCVYRSVHMGLKSALVIWITILIMQLLRKESSFLRYR